MTHPFFPALIGPTGTGKTATLLALREILPFSVIQADSLQAIERFDIGTAKPTAQERAFLPHYGVDVVPPTGRFSAYQFVTMAEKVLQEKSGETFLFSGGTGLYLEAWEKGLTELSEIPEEVRLQARREVAEDPEGVYRRITELDPLFARRVHPHDHRRIARALEIFWVVQEPPIQYLIEGRRKRENRNLTFFGILGEGEEYKQALKLRIERMLAEGWIEEVKGLISEYRWDLPGFEGVGYQEIVSYLKGEIRNLTELKEAILRRTWRYARKQRIFFQRFTVRWYPFSSGGVNEPLIKDLSLVLTDPERWQEKADPPEHHP
jgi:tRNA dimethylallyltransferase